MDNLQTRHVIKQMAIAVVLLSGLGVVGCSNAIRSSSVKATDYSSIEVGATRESVESVLSSPIESTSFDEGKIDTYEYDRGHPGGGRGPWRITGKGYPGWLTPEIFLVPLIEAVLVPIEIKQRQQRIAEQKGTMQVTYGPDDRVVAMGAEAPYQLGQSFIRENKYSEALKWNCLAANQNHGMAQKEIAHSHAYGQVTGGKPDYVQAYMWYDLAASNGANYVELLKEHFAKRMTPEQIAEAKQLARWWRPGDCASQRLAERVPN